MKNSGSQTKRLLLIGFGGLLLLLAVTGLNALSVLRKIQTQNDSIRKDYFNRDGILEQLRSDIYLSGTYVRDLLLEEDPSRADTHRKELGGAQQRIEENVAAYNKILRSEERLPFRQFTSEVSTYFHSLRPALEWDSTQRKTLGYLFMNDSLLPRRMIIVRLADQISGVNQRQMEAGNKQVAVLFTGFRQSLIVLLVLALLCGTLLAGASIQRILRLENISALRFDEVEHARGALRDLSARLVAVQESERRTLSRELHDEVGQSLSALLLGIGNVSAVLSEDTDGDARTQLQDLRRLAERTVAVVRDMSLLLRPSMLDDLGLIPAVEWQAREVSRTKNLAVNVEADSLFEDLPDEHKTCIYRIVQEALQNITRHTRAKSARIRLEQRHDKLLLTIQDDGQGFAAERERKAGLLGMEERVMQLGGSFHADSTLSKGVSIRVELPLLEEVATVRT